MRYLTIILATFLSLNVVAQKSKTDSTSILDDVIVTTKPNTKAINTSVIDMIQELILPYTTQLLQNILVKIVAHKILQNSLPIVL